MTTKRAKSPTRSRKRTAEAESTPLPPMTGAEEQEAFRRFAAAAHQKLRAEKTKVSETEIRQLAYRMYLGL